jgi:thioredoxin 1
MAENILTVNDGNFDTEVLTAASPSPSWSISGRMVPPGHAGASVCGNCSDYAGKLKVTKLNVDEAMNSSARYGIRGIPTLLVFKDGR